MSVHAHPTRTVMDAATELCAAADRYSETIHEVDLIADQLRTRWVKQAVEADARRQIGRMLSDD